MGPLVPWVYAYGTNSQELGLGKNLGSEFFGIPGTNGTRVFEKRLAAVLRLQLHNHGSPG
jgi:hypothetical protein